MVQRPAFLARLTSRFPDFSSLRIRLQTGAGFLGAAFGLCLVLAATHLDARRCEEVARERAETLARTAGFWLDGDAHAGLGVGPEKRLEDLQATLEKLLTASDYDGMAPGGKSDAAAPVGSLCANHERTLSRCCAISWPITSLT